MFLLAVFAVIAWYDGVTDEVSSRFTNWTDRKYEKARNKWAAKKEGIRAKKSKRGRKRLRDIPARAGLNLLDGLWSFCQAVADGSRGALERAREMRDRYLENPDLPRRERMREARTPPQPSAQPTAQTPQPAPAQNPVEPGAQSVVHPQEWGWSCMCGAKGGPYRSLEESQEASRNHPCTGRKPAPTGSANPLPGGDTVTDVQTLEQLRIANARRVAAAVAELEDATADKKSAEEDATRAEAEVRSINALAESVVARWNAQTAAPYLEMASNARITREGSLIRVETATARLRAAEASVEQAQKATAEVEKLAAADEAMRTAGYRQGVDAASSNAA
jgi:hypothetical protein